MTNTCLSLADHVTSSRAALESAILAAHLPHFAGVTVAIRGLHRSVLRSCDDAEIAGDLGVAVGWTDFEKEYRRLAARLTRWADELSDRRQMLERHLRA